MGSDRVSNETWPLVKGLIAGTIVVTVAQVAAALKLLVERAGVTAEGAGAATVAAAMAGAVRGRPGISLDAKRVACIISGGNIDADVLAIIMRGAIP
jgi:threonine dehydratase